MRAPLAIVLAVVTLAGVVLGAAPARADDASREDARRLFLAGSQAFAEGRLALAASSFEAAYRLEPLPALQWNLGQTYQRQFFLDGDVGKLKQAITCYRRYLVESPNGANRDEATRLTTELVLVLSRVAPAEVTGTPQPPAVAPAPPPKTELMVVTEANGATVALDDAPPARAPLVAQVAAGAHRARVAAEGYFPAELNLTAVEGRLVVGEARLSPRPAELRVDGRGADVDVDGKRLGRTPLSLALDAGHHVVTVSERGHEPWRREVELSRGHALALSPSLPTTAPRRAARWMLGFTGAAAAMTLVAGGLWGQAESAAAKLYDQQQRSTITTAQLGQYDSDRARRDAWRTGTLVSLGITVALGGVTAALFAFDTPHVMK